MTVAEYIAYYLEQIGVTDAFGVPGGVILDLLYAFNSNRNIEPHLSYHEQCAGFAAEGYSQSSGKLGVAYVTRGPGVANIITSIADAYFDGIPVLYITAHASLRSEDSEARCAEDQEWNVTEHIKEITKYAASVEELSEVCKSVREACESALRGRKGPVFLDFYSPLLGKSIDDYLIRGITRGDSNQTIRKSEYDDVERAVDITECAVKNAHRPVFLIGDGVNQSKTGAAIRAIAEKSNIPVISSRFAENVMNDSNMYFGYIGSHGLRYTNFILSKADVIISVGNRLSYPRNSKSYGDIFENKELIRIDIDKGELNRKIQGSKDFLCDIKDYLHELGKINTGYADWSKWLSNCNEIKYTLKDRDYIKPIDDLEMIMKKCHKDTTIVSDVGNHEYWLSMAYVKGGCVNDIFYSKSFGTLGSALGKSIGAYYAKCKPVICVVGDQGLQLNLQELQVIKQNSLPISVIVVNNHESGMIRQRQKQRHGKNIHTTEDSGYTSANVANIARAYELQYMTFDEYINELNQEKGPLLVELRVDEGTDLNPSLPLGNPIQMMSPLLDEEMYKKLDSI